MVGVLSAKNATSQQERAACRSHWLEIPVVLAIIGRILVLIGWNVSFRGKNRRSKRPRSRR